MAHSTESHFKQALEANGVEVDAHQENRVNWSKLARQTAGSDFVLWVTTHDYAPPRTYPEQWAFLAAVKGRTPVVGAHLDLWWGLAREHRISEAPFFKADVLFSADGGHDALWAEAGVNHRWMPPGVSEFECGGGTYRPELASPIAFVGSWQSYHPEWQHRPELVRWLRTNYGDRCAFWPKPGEHAIRNEPLRDLYASVDVLVGDSCFAGQLPRFLSDRVPETLGRGGFLLHPHVDGVTDGSLYVDGKHLRTWRAHDWEALRWLIDYYLDSPDERLSIAAQGREHVLATATYTVRVRELLDVLRAERLL